MRWKFPLPVLYYNKFPAFPLRLATINCFSLSVQCHSEDLYYPVSHPLSNLTHPLGFLLFRFSLCYNIHSRSYKHVAAQLHPKGHYVALFLTTCESLRSSYCVKTKAPVTPYIMYDPPTDRSPNVARRGVGGAKVGFFSEPAKRLGGKSSDEEGMKVFHLAEPS